MVKEKTKSNDKTTAKDSLIAYFKGVRAEWGKVTWPEKNQIIVETGIVVFVVAVFTIAVYLTDIIFKGLLGIIAR